MSLLGKSLLFFSLFVLSVVSLFLLLPDGDSDSTETDASSELPVESETPLEAFVAPPIVESDPALTDGTIQELTDVLTVEAAPMEVSDDPATNTTLPVTVPPTTTKASTTQTTAQKTGATTPATNPGSTPSPAPAPTSKPTPVAGPASGGGSVGVSNGNPPQVTSKSTPVNPDAYFVSANGNDSSGGRSEGDAFKSIQKGAEALQPGQTLYVKAGNYGSQTVLATLNGQSGKPITIEGYKNSPGDNPTITGFNHLSSPDAAAMPLLSGSPSIPAAVKLSGSHYQFKNFQISNYQNGMYGRGDNFLIDNVIAHNLGDRNKSYSGHGIFLNHVKDSVLRNSVVVNAGAQALTLGDATNTVVENSAAYSNDDSRKGVEMPGSGGKIYSSTDYYFAVSGSYNNTIRNNYIERVGDLAHVGHGFTIKGTGEGNVFEGNTAVNLKGGGLVARHRGVKNNIYRNNFVRGETCILVRDGADKNLFENNVLQDCNYAAVQFIDTTEDGGKFAAGTNNVFKGLKIRNAGIVISFHWNTYQDTTSSGNTFENLDVDGGDLLIRGQHYAPNNVVKNSSFKNIKNYIDVSKDRTEADIDVKFQNSTCTNCSFTLPN